MVNRKFYNKLTCCFEKLINENLLKENDLAPMTEVVG